MIDFALYLTYIIIIASTLLALGFAFWFVIKNVKHAKATLFGALGLLVIFIISYLISGSEIYHKFGIDTAYSKFIGGTLIMLYIIFAITILVLLYAEIRRFFK